MTAVVNKELNSIVECSICTETFADPRMLPCIHTFCVKCLTKTGSRAKKGPGDKMPCPLCRVEFTIPTGGFTGLQKNFFINKVVEAVQLPSKQHIMCDSNTENCSSVKWYCDECKQKLCDECCTKHKNIHPQEHHNLVPFENQTTDKKVVDFCTSTFCNVHEKEELKIFCNDCHVALCALCFIESHQPHKWSYVTTVAKEFKSEIENNVSIVSSYVPKALSVLEELEKNNVKFLDTVSKVESEVNKKKLQVKALLDEIVEEHASSLLLRLTSLKWTILKQKEIEREEIDRHMTELESYIMSFNEIVARGSDVDICRTVRESNNRVEDFKELHSTVMEQKSPDFDISFAERKSEDFLKTFGNLLGKIEGAANSQHQQQSIMFNQQNTQVIMPCRQYMPYMVQKSPMMSAQSPPPPRQLTAIRKISDGLELYKKLRGILNKITPSTFEELLPQITDLPIDNENMLSGCVAVIFEKAISDPKFAREYSILAQRMMALSVPSTDNPAVKVNFRKLLLNRCQDEFEHFLHDKRVITQRQKEIEATTTDDQKKCVIEEEGESRSLKRSLGNIRFIGELFKQKMLTEKQMHDCIKKLLDAEDEDSLELLCHLLNTIGKELDTDKSRKLMDSYFVRLSDQQGSVPSRIIVIIKDLLELRKNKWIPQRVENIQKTIVEIQRGANKEMELAKPQLLNRVPPHLRPRPDRRFPGSSSTEKPGDDGWTMAVR